MINPDMFISMSSIGLVIFAFHYRLQLMCLGFWEPMGGRTLLTTARTATGEAKGSRPLL